MNLTRALEHLDSVGVTVDVLAASGVDPTCPAAVRGEVEMLLHTALAEDMITDMRGLAALQMALGALLTDTERDHNEALAAVVRGDLVATGVLIPAGN